MIRTQSVVFAAALVLAAGVAAKDEAPRGVLDYASQWPILAEGEGAFAITLTPEVYRQLHRGDLADLAAFAADGTPLAFGPLPPSLVPPAPRWRDARWFALPQAGTMPARDLHIHATRSTQGELSFDATVVGSAIDKEHPDLLIDLQAGAEAVDQLDFEFAPDAGPVNAQMVVESSDDLQRWKTLLDTATVARLEQDGAVLERRIVELPATNAAFLRLRPAEGTTALPLKSVRVRLQPAAPEQRVPEAQWLDATFVRQEGRTYFYSMPARIPAQRLDIALGSDNAVDQFTVSSREGPVDERREFWIPRGNLTAFRLRGAGVELDNAPLEFPVTRDHEWRLDARTDLPKPPTVRFGYHPETWLLLTHGPAPYALAAGSARAERGDFPLDTLYSQVRARYGGEWTPPPATLGKKAIAGGPAALLAPAPDQKRTWVLWGILILGALAIVGMVMKLMGEKRAEN